jgi:hypothetical protein
MTTQPLTRTAGPRLTAAGIDWDAVKVPRFYALQALKRLASPGAIAVDPVRARPVLYFFVPAGSTVGWDVQHSDALGTATHVVLPPATKELPPGPYWLIPPKGGQVQLTRIDALRAAIEDAIAPAGGRAS